jgi:outer membrane immunogenic protein
MPRQLNSSRPFFGLALLGLVLGTIGYAHAVQAEPFRGAYAGAEIGLDAATGPDGFTYGGFAGWDVRLGERFVVGPEFRISDSTTDLDIAFPELPGANVTAESGRQIGASVRAGYLVRPDLLAFGRVGWENLKVRAAFMGEEASAIDDSLTLGAGLQYALSDRWSVRGTYDWVEGSDRHLLKAGVGFHF